MPRISPLAETPREPRVPVMTARHRRVPRDRVAEAPHAPPGRHARSPVTVSSTRRRPGGFLQPGARQPGCLGDAHQKSLAPTARRPAGRTRQTAPGARSRPHAGRTGSFSPLAAAVVTAQTFGCYRSTRRALAKPVPAGPSRPGQRRRGRASAVTVTAPTQRPPRAKSSGGTNRAGSNPVKGATSQGSKV